MVRQAVREASFRSLLPCEDKLPLKARIAASGSAALKTLTNTPARVNRVLLLNLRGRRRGPPAARSYVLCGTFRCGVSEPGGSSGGSLLEKGGGRRTASLGEYSWR